MRNQNKFFFIIAFLSFLMFSIPLVNAQNYYYNNFDTGQMAAITQTSSNASLGVSTTSPLSGTHSLSSLGNGQTGRYKIAAIAPNTNLGAETYGWEWTFLYRNTEDNTNSNNTWKYWLVREADQANSRGCYLIQENKKLKLVFYQDQNNTWSNDIADLSKNKTYAIRVQRKSQNGWVVYLDEADSAPNGAYTKKVSIGWYPTGGATYHSSLLELSSTTAGRFTFDELKMYSMQLQITGASNSSNGISNPLYAGQQAAAIYGLKMQTRGFFDMYQFALALTGNITTIIDKRSVKLYKSADSYFVKKEEDKVVDFSSNNIWDGGIQYWGDSNNPFTSFYSVGHANGSVAVAGYYFLTADVLANPSAAATFAISGMPTITSAATGINYTEVTGTVSNIAAESSSSGKIFDWKGTVSSAWNNSSNWKPNNEGVPTGKDFVRIGEVENFTNQPTVSSSTGIGNLIFGTKKTAVLTVDPAAVLTVNGNMDTKEGITVTGQGAIDVKGAYTSALTAAETVTGSIATFTVNDLVLYGKTKTLTYEAISGNTVIKNVFSTKGTNAVTFTLLNAATLTLTGANPFSLYATANTISLNNGTVVYGATVQQNVSTTHAYKNLSFSGLGVKTVASGTLNVSGSWNSAGGKIDLLSNDATVAFNGAAQAINDAGSDSGKGIVFGNIVLSGGTKTLSATGKFALAVGKYLTLGANTIFQTSNNLTLKASALGSASVAVIPSNSSVQGKVVVEKYIQGGGKNTWRTYRMLSSPIYDNSASFTSQDVAGNRTYSFTQFIDDMIIGGKGGASNGFDVTPTNPATAWTYNKGFKEIENINTSINVGYGAYLFFCGNRNNITAKVTPPFVDAESIVMTFEGVLNQQKVTVPLTGANLVGNPYAATIDWNSVSKSSNVSSIIRVWNPSNRQYSTYNGEFEINGGSKYLGPGQAFFVQTTDGAPGVVTFTEAAKVSNTSQAAALYNVVMTAPVKEEKSIVTNLGKLGVATSGNVYSNSTLSQPSKIRIKLLREGTENSDETLVVLKNNELATVSGNDVTKMNGETVFLSSLSQEGRLMAINYMPHVSVISTIKLDVKADNSGAYKLMCTSEDIPFGYEAKLNDKYLNTITNLEAENTIYSFAIDKTVAASYGSNRFEILLSPVTTLPVNVSEFTGSRNNEGVLLKWTTSLEENNSYFEVFRGGDQQEYASIGIVEANKSGVYSILDKAPLNGNNYYSLVQVDKDGKSTPYPQPVTVKYGLNVKASNQLLVYPTIVESNFTLKYSGANASNRFIVKISDLTGKNIFHKEVGKNDLLNGYSASFPATSSGAYFVSLIDAASKKNIASAKLFKK